MSKKLPKIKSTGHNGSNGVLAMAVSVVVPEKFPGQKVWKWKRRRRTKKETCIFWHFRHLIKI